jgi:predicted ABC-type transport system involved in lysophospholipase L1 biosynthesis ATPase subunit
MNAEVSLSCEGIQRYLGEEGSRVHTLRGVSLQLERGTVRAVVGPSALIANALCEARRNRFPFYGETGAVAFFLKR